LLVLFHPVVQEGSGMQAQTLELARALHDAATPRGLHIVWLSPNADAGSAEILQALDGEAGIDRLHRITHLERPLFVAALKQAEALVGNSSAGIIESASVGTPVVNVGSRQQARERNANTRDCEGNRA